MADENGGNGDEIAEEIADEIAEEIADEIDDETGDIDAEVETEIVVNEAPEIPEVASVDVGDLHISGPPDMVRSITQKYLDDHLDHNPHGEEHTPGEMVEDAAEMPGEAIDTIGEAITPEPVEELIRETAAGETADSPPGPTDWLFRERGGA